MQTFFPEEDINKTVRCLDNKRLGKQRVETIQILNILLGISPNSSWKNHPAVKMWKGYEPYLVKVYLKKVLEEWERRGFRNTKCKKHWINFMLNSKIRGENAFKPLWINKEFCEAHKSNLVRKDPEHYKKWFPNVLDTLNYKWPGGTKNEEENRKEGELF
jgi:hypothetical protein